MTNLEQLAALLFDAIVNLDPQEFDAVADAVRIAATTSGIARPGRACWSCGRGAC